MSVSPDEVQVRQQPAAVDDSQTSPIVTAGDTEFETKVAALISGIGKAVNERGVDAARAISMQLQSILMTEIF